VDSIICLQTLLNESAICNVYLGLSFEGDKSWFVLVRHCFACSLSLNDSSLPCGHIFNYLRVTFTVGRRTACDADYVTRKFHSASNCIFSDCSEFTEIMHLLHLQCTFCPPLLQCTFCPPLLQYASFAFQFSVIMYTAR
jgi:hypothetical protein